MKNILLLLAVVIFYSCTKDPNNPDNPPAPLLKSYAFSIYDTSTNNLIFEDTVRFSYDNEGKIIRIVSDVADINNQIDVLYDSQNRVIELKDHGNLVMVPFASRKYAYAPDGKLQSITGRNNDSINFSYLPSPGGYTATVLYNINGGFPSLFTNVLWGHNSIVFDTISKSINAIDVNDPDQFISYRFNESGVVDMMNSIEREGDSIFRYEYSDRSSSIPHPLYTAYHSIFGNILWSYMFETYSNLFYFPADYAGNINNSSLSTIADRNYILLYEEYLSYTTVMEGTLVKSIQKRSETGKLIEDLRFYY
jgi:hypothetical protein